MTIRMLSLSHKSGLALILLGSGLGIIATPTAIAAQAQMSAQPRAASPVSIGPVQGQSLLQALRRGGLILWMRHGARDDGPGDVSDQQAASHDCTKQSRLTPTGEEQVRMVGRALRAIKVPVAAVHTARLCRTEATARLLGVAPVSIDARLDEASTWTDRGGNAAYQKAVLDILSTRPPAGSNVIEVTSKLTFPNARPAVLADLGEAEIAVFEPRPGGSPRLLARIGADAWEGLIKQAAMPPRQTRAVR